MLKFDKTDFDELLQEEIFEFDDLVRTLKYMGNTIDFQKIKKAYIYASNMHKGQKRESGQDYIVHPLNVAFILAQIGCDTETVIAGLLHDVVEDTDATIDDIRKEFGDDVATIVNGVTNLTEYSTREMLSKTDRDYADLRKVMVSAAQDGRIFIVKIADRLHNMRTLSYKNNIEKQKLKSIETIDIYAPLARRLGIYRICTELEDLSLKYLNPSKYFSICEEVEEYKKRRQKVINEMEADFQKILIDRNIDAIVKQRVRNAYSIFRKKKAFGNNFSYDEMHDLLAIKIIIDDVNSKYSKEAAKAKCFELLGIIHSHYKPYNNNGFRDYIYNPKSNMYQSLHTVVVNDGALVQTQIRTKTMSLIGSFGMPMLFLLNSVYSLEARQKYFSELVDVIRSTDKISDNEKAISLMMKEALAPTISVCARDGRIIQVPNGSTAIDFAYRIHTELGNKMCGVLVNDKEVPLDYVLEPKDRVYILTSPDAKPLGLEYVDRVYTDKAKTNIKKNNRR